MPLRAHTHPPPPILPLLRKFSFLPASLGFRPNLPATVSSSISLANWKDYFVKTKAKRTGLEGPLSSPCIRKPEGSGSSPGLGPPRRAPPSFLLAVKGPWACFLNHTPHTAFLQRKSLLSPRNPVHLSKPSRPLMCLAPVLGERPPCCLGVDVEV